MQEDREAVNLGIHTLQQRKVLVEQLIEGKEQETLGKLF